MRNHLDVSGYNAMGEEGKAAVDAYLQEHGIEPGAVYEIWFRRTDTIVYGYWRNAGGNLVRAPYGFDGSYPRVWRIPAPPEPILNARSWL